MISFAAEWYSIKKGFLFTITPFITQRCLEQIKTDLSYPNLPVTNSRKWFEFNICLTNFSSSDRRCCNYEIITKLKNT